MKTYFLFALMVALIPAAVCAQETGDFDSLSLRIKSADSIVLIRYQSKGASFLENREISEAEGDYFDGISHRVSLDSANREALLAFLCEGERRRGRIAISRPIHPRFAILFFDKNELSFIDVSFNPQGISVSKGIG
ncbi:MAG: hypothetical protein EOO88_01260 [Pedobacter sp.]|nr:MAG: hypothetical protein EOO88_01260 [Pedobacter sp.]